MKTYPHVIAKLFYEPVAITPAGHAALVRVLEARLSQGEPLMEFTPGGGMADGQWPMARRGKHQSSSPKRQRSGAQGSAMEDDDGERDAPLEPDWQTFGADAVIPVHGTLVGHARDIPASSCGCGLDTVSAMIEAAMADDQVQKIIFDFSSPGGQVVGIPELGERIANITTKKTLAFTDSQCCSAALWLATQCQYFYATGSAIVGSIGVWCAALDLSRQLANEGIAVQEISAGKYKTMGAYWKPLTAEQRAMIQKRVDHHHAQFKEAVLLHREIAAEYMEGQSFDGEEALVIGLTDGIVDSLADLLENDE